MKPDRWYLLIHHVPAHPLYLRAKIRKLLARSGAVALKKSVYALPQVDAALERFQKVAAAIRREGGEAYICETQFPDPQDHDRMVDLVRRQRSADYERLARSAVGQSEALRGASRSGQPISGKPLSRFRRDLAWIKSVDFFGAPGSAAAEKALDELERAGVSRARRATPGSSSPWVARTWVTRRGVHVDRIACAWFVRRFLDPQARFRFVAPGQGGPRPGEVGFDMPDVEFTHEGDRCSFESLIEKSGRKDAALERIAGIVHDIDLKDGKFRYEEAPGIERLLAGILAAHPDDQERIERGATLFDDLYRSLSGRPRISVPAGISALRPRRPGSRGKP